MEQGSLRERILVVDDEHQVSDIIAQCLKMEGYPCDTADCAEAALDLCTRNEYALIVSDIMMPGKSGIELLGIVRRLYPDVAIVMVTAVDDRTTAVNALHLGAYGYVIKPFDLNEIVIGVVNALERRRLSIQSREYEQRLENDVRQRTADIQRREEEVCLRLAAACGYRDLETGKHYVFLTNNFKLSAKTIADIYKERWQIETFFRWIKQNLKIKAFIGNSPNAVMTQIYVAMIAYLLLSFLKFLSGIGVSLQNIVRVVQLNLFRRCSLRELFKPPPNDTINTINNSQLNLITT